jgi:hypothetical protein
MNVSYAMVMGRVRIHAPTRWAAINVPAMDYLEPVCPTTCIAVRMPANVLITTEVAPIDACPRWVVSSAFAPMATYWTMTGERVKVLFAKPTKILYQNIRLFILLCVID